MTDLLDMMDETEDDAYQVSAGYMYISQRAPQDFIGEVVEAGIDVHENPESPLNGEKYFRLLLKYVSGDTCVAAVRAGDGYENEVAKEGDQLGTTIELASKGIKASKAKINMKNLARLAAAFSEGKYRTRDLMPKQDPGPSAIKTEIFDDPSKFIGRQVHVTTVPGKDGWHNPRFELVPETKKKAKKAS